MEYISTYKLIKHLKDKIKQTEDLKKEWMGIDVSMFHMLSAEIRAHEDLLIWIE